MAKGCNGIMETPSGILSAMSAMQANIGSCTRTSSSRGSFLRHIESSARSFVKKHDIPFWSVAFDTFLEARADFAKKCLCRVQATVLKVVGPDQEKLTAAVEMAKQRLEENFGRWKRDRAWARK